MDKSKATKTVDEYIEGFPEDVRRILEELRRVIRQAAPQATETISYQMPAYMLGGPLVYFAAFKGHIGFFPTAEGKEAFAEELKDYKGGRGTVQFPLGRPLPTELIDRIVRHRVEANMQKA